MNGKILVTDSLFIYPEHEQMIREAGYEVERLDKPEATEDEIVDAIKGKVGYILGGTEKVTEKVIEAADALKVISFTGIGYKGFIPAWEVATQKRIAITNAPDGPTYAVAEWALTMALSMSRGVFELGRAGEKKFMTTKGLEGQTIGFVGLGRIGRAIAEMSKVFRPASLSYYSKNRHEDAEQALGIGYKELDEVLASSDIIFVGVSIDAGENFIGTKELAKIKEGALVVSFVHKGIINEDALLAELQKGRIRAVSDEPFTKAGFENLPLGTWYCFNGSNAFNTFASLKRTSDMTTRALLNVLQTGKDEYRVN